MSEGPSFLIYGDERPDVGVRVITYLEPGAPDFAAVKARSRKKTGFFGGDSIFDKFSGQSVSRKAGVNQILLHHDGTRSSRQCYDVLVNRGLSTHLMIDGDGTVYQPLDLKFTAWHAGDRNETSVGIDLNNPIRPERVRDPALRGVFRGRINNTNTASLGYTDRQYESLIAVIRGLSRIFPKLQEVQAPLGADGLVVRNKLVNDAFTGLVGHWHVSATKWDPGPGFDWERVLIGVRGKRLFYPVSLPQAVNLDRVPKRQALRNAEVYFRNTETGRGGFYPVGGNQAWHSGVHLNVEPGTPVVAPADGVIVAARNTKRTSRMGSANMVVIRHEMEVAGNTAKFFSVISHLRPEKLGGESPISWIRRFALDPNRPSGLPNDGGGVHPPAAPGHVALQNKRVALGEVPVKAGEIIGYSDTFNPDPYGDKDQMMQLIDWAIISERPLFPVSDPTFDAIDEDDDDGILCNARKVWKQITTKPEELRGLVEGGYPLAPEEVRAVYQDPRIATAMRWMATRHVTEYSDTTDFSGLFGGGTDFEWSTRKVAERYVKDIRKFLWWDEEVTEHLELPPDRLVWTYHPIALTTLLAIGEARRVVTTDVEVKALDGDALAAAKRRDALAEAAFAEQFGTGRDSHVTSRVDDIDARDDFYQIEADDPEREGWMRWEQGEWEP